MTISNSSLIDFIRRRACHYLDGGKRNESVLAKMLEVDRALFLPQNVQTYAYIDEPVPIGFNQTCSQPSMVAFILDQLNIEPGNKVLEIGSGCGYAAAIASKLCGNKGKVWAVEIISELAKMSQENLSDNYRNISILNRDGSTGLQEEMPFDRIFLSAGVNSNSFNNEILLNQLADHGILIYPEAQGRIFKITKINNSYEIINYYGVSFVPLIGENV